MIIKGGDIVEQPVLNHANEKLEIVYMSSSGTLTQRTVRVVSYDEVQVLAYCYLRNEIRRFSKENILAAFPKTLQH